MLQKFKTILAIGLCFLLLAACGPQTPAVTNTGQRIAFVRYHFWDGWAPDYIYVVEQHDDAELWVLDGWKYGEREPDWETLFTEEMQREFMALLDEYNIWAWNGFDESEEVMDAGAIHIRIEFENGDEIVVNGFAVFPPNFYEANEAVLAFFEGIEQSVLYPAQPEPCIGF